MKQLNVDEFPRICRLCLCERNVHTIRKIRRNDVALIDLINTYISIKVEEDEMPQKICKICENKVYSTHSFIESCRKSELILKDVCNKVVVDDSFDVSDDLPLINLIKDTNGVSKDSLSDENGVDDDDFDETEDKVEDEELLVEKKRRGRKKGSKNKVYPDGPKLKRRRVYSCKVCDEIFDDLEAVKKHRIEFRHLRLKKHMCPTCNKSFECNYRLKEHIRTHTGERPNVCDTCNKRFNSKSDLKRHVIIIHLNIKKFKCQYCDKGFSRKFYLRDHERTHTGERLYSSCCAKEFTSYYSLYHHEKKHKYNKKYVKKVDPNKPVKEKSEDEGSYPCYICPKVLRTDYSLKRHIAVQHDLRNLTCDECGGTYTSIRQLNEHIRTTHKDHPYTLAHNIKEFNCVVCAKEFKYKSSLRDHMRVHTGDTKFKCSECDKICLNKRKLNEHMRIHTGEKPYTCSYCGKNFRTLTNMSEHQKTHTGERNHMCAKCGKSFYDARSLKKHSATHEGNV